VAGLANVAEASFNAATRLLSVTLRDAGSPRPVLDDIQAIVANVEPDALAREYFPTGQEGQKVWLLEGWTARTARLKSSRRSEEPMAFAGPASILRAKH
jgi:hypothetical protein